MNATTVEIIRCIYWQRVMFRLVSSRVFWMSMRLLGGCVVVEAAHLCTGCLLWGGVRTR